ncbi:MAG: peptidase prepilin type [Nocardioidaceae bacterium]|nr:peptidase prepilin type [Nocardioidaceae bacterium]
MDHVIAAVVCGALAGLAGWFVPRLVAAVPEPEPDDPPREPPKTLYVDVAAAPGLASRAAAASAAIGVVVGAWVGWDWALLFLVPWAPFGVALSVIDWRTRLLPTWLLAPAYPVTIALVVLAGVLSQDWADLRRAFFGWLVLGGYYVVLWLISPRMMGYGDVRLAGLLGIMLGFLGWGEVVVGLFAPFFVFGIPVALTSLVKRRRPVGVPFGPAMLLAALLTVAIGGPIGHWYAERAGF